MIELFSSHGQSITDDEITNFIQDNNIQLPVEYKNFLKEVNGGRTINTAFELRKFDLFKKNINYYVDIEMFFSINLLQEVWEYVKTDLNEYSLFPIADVNGGMLICCKQTDSVNAELYFYDQDFDVVPLNLSLNGFLNNLIPEDDVDFKKYGIDYY